MQQCPNCGHPNRAGVVFCENCGANLLGVALSTKSLDPARAGSLPGGVDSSVLLDVKVHGTEQFDPADTLRLEVEASPEPILINPKPETIFGRRDPATGAMPDIDLTPFAGYRMGVSRRHAAIRHGDDHTLDLWDLGSSNGTFLNGQRLSAHRPYRVRDGDEIRLGQLIMRVYFDPAGKPAPHKPQQQTPQNGKPAPPGAAPPHGPGGPPIPGTQSFSARKETGTLLRPPTGPRPVDSVPMTGHLKPPRPASPPSDGSDFRRQAEPVQSKSSPLPPGVRNEKRD